MVWLILAPSSPIALPCWAQPFLATSKLGARISQTQLTSWAHPSSVTSDLRAIISQTLLIPGCLSLETW
jgi:hypothetical protein